MLSEPIVMPLVSIVSEADARIFFLQFLHRDGHRGESAAHGRGEMDIKDVLMGLKNGSKY
jgi:hypothetical protein